MRAMVCHFVRGKTLSESLLTCLKLLKSYCEHRSSLYLCDEQNQTLNSNTSKLWAFCPALLLAWRK